MALFTKCIESIRRTPRSQLGENAFSHTQRKHLPLKFFFIDQTLGVCVQRDISSMVCIVHRAIICITSRKEDVVNLWTIQRSTNIVTTNLSDTILTNKDGQHVKGLVITLLEYIAITTKTGFMTLTIWSAVKCGQVRISMLLLRATGIRTLYEQ
jgi:hypothetical protein